LTNLEDFELMAPKPMIARSLILAGTFAALLSSCTTDDVRQSAIIGGGAAVGSAIGYAAGKGQKNQDLYAAGGGAAGAAAGAIIAGPNKSYGDKRFQEGYDQASSNDVKALYWMKQNLEQGSQFQGGRQTYYSLPSQDIAPDGTRYVPHQVVVPIVE
jgi:hypothetical protein